MCFRWCNLRRFQLRRTLYWPHLARTVDPAIWPGSTVNLGFQIYLHINEISPVYIYEVSPMWPVCSLFLSAPYLDPSGEHNITRDRHQHRRIFPAACLHSSLTWARGRGLQVVSVVMSELSVAVRVGVFRFGGVRSRGSHSVQVKLVVRVHGLSVRLTLVVFVLAVSRLSAEVAHVGHRRLGQSWGVLGVRVAAHRSRQVGQNTRNLLLVRLPGAHGWRQTLLPKWTQEKSTGVCFPRAIEKHKSVSVCGCVRARRRSL